MNLLLLRAEAFWLLQTCTLADTWTLPPDPHAAEMCQKTILSAFPSFSVLLPEPKINPGDRSTHTKCHHAASTALAGQPRQSFPTFRSGCPTNSSSLRFALHIIQGHFCIQGIPDASTQWMQVLTAGKLAVAFPTQTSRKLSQIPCCLPLGLFCWTPQY